MVFVTKYPEGKQCEKMIYNSQLEITPDRGECF